jgi:ABC-type Fe3+/spermidine/putrescine transport system ATPase subunit
MTKIEPPFLEARGLVKSFGSTRVLQGVDFAVRKGERLVLLGPSGCGKTTLLNLIAGMLPADEGELLCDGEVIDSAQRGVHTPMRRRGFAMVFQDFALWPHMTVAENVAFGLRIQGTGRSERRERVSEVLRMVQMEGFADRRPTQLSGGQQQRVSIARALAVRPRLLLLDEPLSALDARLREDLKVELSMLLRETGVTSVYVTHDQSEAFTLASRIALMNEGRLEQIGTPQEVYAHPASIFAATFLGVSNLLAGSRENGHFRLTDGTAIPLASSGGAAPAAGRLMVRRESVSVHAGRGDENGSVALAGICRRKDFLGDRYEAFVEVSGGVTLRGFAMPGIEVGADVEVRFPPDAVQFLTQ